MAFKGSGIIKSRRKITRLVSARRLVRLTTINTIAEKLNGDADRAKNLVDTAMLTIDQKPSKHEKSLLKSITKDIKRTILEELVRICNCIIAELR